MTRWGWCWSLPVLVALSGCGSAPDLTVDSGLFDAGRPDAGRGDAGVGDAGQPEPDIALRLAALPGVTAAEQAGGPPGYRYFVLQFTQPVDHANPTGPTFQQEVSLIHRDVSAPMIAETTGYDDYLLDYESEPAELLNANQISIEHRYFGTSRPSPADWSKLTIKQMADDEHAIISALRTIYGAAWISTGASKGGMTAIYHRRFYPDDVDGTVAYVAPQSFSTQDARYPTFLDGIGTAACRNALRAISLEMLKNRRQAMLSRATSQASQLGYAYHRVALGPSVESAIASLEWSFWQYAGINACEGVPAVTASDDALFSFLDQSSPVWWSDDPEITEFDAYYYQAFFQLGSPGPVSNQGNSTPAQLVSELMFTEADYAGSFPPGVALPTFDATAMQDIDAWVQGSGSHLVFVYGQWDPWSGGEFRLGNATDSLELVVAQGTHDSSLAELATGDRQAAYAKLEAWSGVSVNAPTHPPPQRRSQRHRH